MLRGFQAFQALLCIENGPFPVTVANKGLYGFPTKNVVILVYTVHVPSTKKIMTINPKNQPSNTPIIIIEG